MIERLDMEPELSGFEKLESLMELPDDSGEILFQMELPDDAGEVSFQTELPDPLTMEEKVEKQELEIQAVESGDKFFDRNNTKETGNYGEMKTDQSLRTIGFERISRDIITDIDEAGHHGIDGVYYNNDTEQYLIVDAKYGTAQLNPETKDGKQMSENWINQRLDGDLGKEKADEIRLEMLLNPEKVFSLVAHVKMDGSVIYDKLDGSASVIERNLDLTEKSVITNG